MTEYKKTLFQHLAGMYRIQDALLSSLDEVNWRLGGINKSVRIINLLLVLLTCMVAVSSAVLVYNTLQNNKKANAAKTHNRRPPPVSTPIPRLLSRFHH